MKVKVARGRKLTLWHRKLTRMKHQVELDNHLRALTSDRYGQGSTDLRHYLNKHGVSFNNYHMAPHNVDFSERIRPYPDICLALTDIVEALQDEGDSQNKRLEVRAPWRVRVFGVRPFRLTYKVVSAEAHKVAAAVERALDAVKVTYGRRVPHLLKVQVEVVEPPMYISARERYAQMLTAQAEEEEESA